MLEDPVPVWRPVRLALFEGSSAGGACTGKAYVGLKLWCSMKPSWSASSSCQAKRFWKILTGMQGR
jgi:hypothetical protein